MKRKPFNSPFLMMLIITLIALLMDFQTLRYMRMANLPVRINPFYFIFTVVYAIEAFIYFRLRYRIEEPGNAWTHVFLLLIGVYGLSFVNTIFNDQIMDRRPFSMARLILYVRMGCWILAHIFFGIAVVKALKRKAPEPQDGQRHLLDDMR